MIQKKNNIREFGHMPETKDAICWEQMESSQCGSKFLADKGLTVRAFLNIKEGQGANKLRKCFYSESDLKNWLYEEFLYQFFDEKERKWIKNISIPNIEQIKRWFPDEKSRICIPTEYAIKKERLFLKAMIPDVYVRIGYQTLEEKRA